MGILFLLAGLIATATCFYDRPKVEVEPKGYRVDLYAIGDGTFKGRVRIDLVNHGAEAVSELKLNSKDLKIDEAEIKLIRLANADLSDEESEEDTPISVNGVEIKDNLLKIQCSQKLQRDASYQLEINYEGKLGEDSRSPLYVGSYNDKDSGELRLFTVLSPAIGQAREIFPCFDQPFLKSWFELSVVHRKDYTAISNMPVLEMSNFSRDGDQVRSQFSRTPLMAVNSLGLFISDFKMPEVEYLQTGLWGRSDFVSTLSKAQQILPSVLVSLELYLSRPYPLPHLNLIALPGYTDDRPKNSWGLQWFKESDLMNTNSYWLTHRVAKAAAMQWLSHLASPINDSIVTSGLANFLATNVAQQLEPTMYHWNLGSFHTLVLELGKPRNYGLDSEQKRSLMESRGKNLYYETKNNSVLVYLLIQMLEQVFGPNTFKQSIQNFLAKKEFKAYSEDDLWQVITEQAWVDKKLSPSISLSDVIFPWLKQRVPLISLSTNVNTNTTTFHQESYVDNLENTWAKVVKKSGADKQSGWWLPLVVAQGGKEPETIGWLSPDQYSIDIKLAPSSYIVVNPGSTGPYLVNYDAENWNKLARNIKELPVTYRAQLIHDSLTLALSGHLNTVTALEISAALKSEQAPEVWRTFYPLAERLRDRFQGTAAASLLDSYLKGLLIPVLDALGEEDKSAWKTELRVRTRHLLCQTGFSPCIDSARTSFATWLNATHPDDGMPISSSHLCPVMAWGNYEEWQFALDRLYHFPTNRSKAERTFLMKTISGCPHDAKKYEMLLNMTFLNRKNREIFTDEDRFIILSAISGESIGYTTLFNFLKYNWQDVKKRIQGNLWDYFVQTAMGNFRTEEGLKEVTELLVERKNELGTALKTAEDSVNRVRNRVLWARESTPAVESWLNKTMEASWTPQRFKFQDVVVVSQNVKLG